MSILTDCDALPELQLLYCKTTAVVLQNLSLSTHHASEECFLESSVNNLLNVLRMHGTGPSNPGIAVFSNVLN